MIRRRRGRSDEREDATKIVRRESSLESRPYWNQPPPRTDSLSKNLSHISRRYENGFKGSAARNRTTLQGQSWQPRRLAACAHEDADVIDIPQLAYQAAARKSKFSQFSRFDDTRRIQREQINPHLLDSLGIRWEWEPRDDYYIHIPSNVTDRVIRNVRRMSRDGDSMKKMQAETEQMLAKVTLVQRIWSMVNHEIHPYTVQIQIRE